MAKASLDRRAASLALVAAALSALAGPAAAQAKFAGQWLVTAAVVAPWDNAPKDPVDAKEAKRFVGAQADDRRQGPDRARTARLQPSDL